MSGVSLIETIVVIAIIATLSTMGVNSFINFKNDSSIDNATNEFISDMKLARNKSMNGEILEGEKTEDFDPNGLPKYGLNISNNSYQLIRNCLKADGTTTCEGEPTIENINLDPEYTFSEDEDYTIEFYFERITGKTEELTLTIEKKGGSYGRQISISSDFLITITKI